MNNTPALKQTRLLGATIHNLGIITAVSTRLSDAYALVEDADRKIHHVFLRDLTREDVTFPAAPFAFATQTERIGYGTWDEVHCLIPAVQVAWEVAA